MSPYYEGENLKELKNFFIHEDLNISFYVLEKIIYNKLHKYSPCNNFFNFGNPKFDIIFKERRNKTLNIKNYFPKFDQKKILLWCFAHPWNSKAVAIDLYIKHIIDYFLKNEDIALIIRPHTAFIFELKCANLWSDEDVNILKNFCYKSKNIIWDDSDTYEFSYSVADCVITDICSGVCLTSLVLDIPVAVLHRFDNNYFEPQYPELNKILYHIHNYQEFDSFIESKLKKTNDPLKIGRNNFLKNNIANFDGLNGKRIKHFIISKFEEYTTP